MIFCTKVPVGSKFITRAHKYPKNICLFQTQFFTILLWIRISTKGKKILLFTSVIDLKCEWSYILYCVSGFAWIRNFLPDWICNKLTSCIRIPINKWIPIRPFYRKQQKISGFIARSVSRSKKDLDPKRLKKLNCTGIRFGKKIVSDPQDLLYLLK